MYISNLVYTFLLLRIKKGLQAETAKRIYSEKIGCDFNPPWLNLSSPCLEWLLTKLF